MNRSAAVPMLGIVVLAAGLFWWWSTASREVAAPGGTPLSPSAPGGDAAATDAPPVRASTPDTPAASEALRTEAPDTAKPSTPQGLRGLVLDDSQRPLGGVQVHLLESAANDPLSVPLILQQRLPASPMASTQSAADGTFAIGLPRVQDRIYELYLLSPAHATVRIAELRLLADQWHDLGAITLVPGTTLRGRVTVEGLSTPVPNAVVVVEPGTAFDDVHRRSLPEGHHGLVATTDATGRYELPHAPARGAVRISAVAAGFARVVHKDIELGAEVVELDFALAPGWTLRGVVRDAAGAPVSQARIEAWPNLAASPALVATSDHAGSFEVQGLSAGPHRVRAIARGFQSYEVTDVAAGRSDLVLVLPRRGRVAVRATTADGTVLRTYQLHVRRWFDDRGGQLGLVPDVPEQSVRLDGFTDRSVLDGLPNGRFVCEVAADGFARSLSPPFEVAGDPGPQAQAIDVVVHRGATLRGRVLRDDGAPLAGAEVVTGTDGADPDSPFWKLVVGSVPSRVTQAKATTALDGSFALPHLMDGAYQLEVRHPEVCRTIVRGIELVAEQDLTVPPVVAQRGAIVTGRATIGGRLAGQIKVVLTEAPGSVPGPTTRLETVTDANGAFRLPRRVPPGSYELRAAVVGSAEPDAQFLRQLLQLQRSSTTVTVPSGADLVEQDIDIPDAR